MELTKQQRRVLVFLKHHWNQPGGQPLSEIAESLGMHYVSLRQHLDAIASKGFIPFESTRRGKPPIIRVKDDGVPLIGDMAAGLPYEAESYTHGYLKLRGGGNRSQRRLYG